MIDAIIDAITKRSVEAVMCMERIVQDKNLGHHDFRFNVEVVLSDSGKLTVTDAAHDWELGELNFVI
jgi:hypothetical protein